MFRRISLLHFLLEHLLRVSFFAPCKLRILSTFNILQSVQSNLPRYNVLHSFQRRAYPVLVLQFKYRRYFPCHIHTVMVKEYDFKRRCRRKEFEMKCFMWARCIFHGVIILWLVMFNWPIISQSSGGTSIKGYMEHGRRCHVTDAFSLTIPSLTKYRRVQFHLLRRWRAISIPPSHF